MIVAFEIWREPLSHSNQLAMRRFYLNGVDKLFARIDSGGVASWYLRDRLWSVRTLVNGGGSAQDTIT